MGESEDDLLSEAVSCEDDISCVSGLSVSGCPEVVLDLSRVRGLDSAGSGLVAWLLHRVSNMQGELSVVAEGEVWNILDNHQVFDGLDTQVAIVETIGCCNNFLIIQHFKVFPHYLDAVTISRQSPTFRSSSDDEMSTRMKLEKKKIEL